MWNPKQILTQNNHPRSFRVIYCSVTVEPLKGYIVGYNVIIVALNVKVRKKEAIFDDPTLI